MRVCRVFASFCILLFVGHGLAAANSGGSKVWLSDLDISKTQQGWGQPRKNRAADGNPLKIAGKTFDRGLGTHADSVLCIELDGSASKFHALVGVDDEVLDSTRDGGAHPGSVEFRVLGDGKQLYKSGVMRSGDPAKEVEVDLAGVKTLILMVDSGNDMNYDHADWADAYFTVSGAAPKTIDAPKEEAMILTPKPSPKPRINSARVFGVRPGSPVLYTIAASGQRPLWFSAQNLPEGLTLNRETGQITGQLRRRGQYKITMVATNDLGEAKKELRLMVGDTIALTPPMGWNSWNCWGCAVDEKKIRESAEAMVKSGLINHGWQYINIDDCWMVRRDSDDAMVGGKTRDEAGRILTNKRFPDMNALTNDIHSMGLKAGLYISPGPWTCAGYEGSWQYEQLDARQFAAWGFDYLKYDWCGYGSIVRNPNLAQMQEPYRFMRMCLDRVDRDIVYSLCQYGMGDVWKWGTEVGGNCWRTTGDITDSWGSMSGIGFNQADMAPYASPGHWNDPDMLVVGLVGWGPNLRESRLTPNEQYTHISLWCLLSSPLLIGCDLTRIDDFTMNLLTNDEVLEVNQDPLGEQARRVTKEDTSEVWAKKMEDGSLAVGLFNRNEIPQTVTAKFPDLHLKGKVRVRDLWRQKDLGTFENSFGGEVPRHGVTLVRLFPAE